MFAFILPLIVSIFVASPISTIHAYTTEDIYVNGECSTPAQFGDHVLLEYSILLANGSYGSVLKRPSQLVHTILKSEVRYFYLFDFYSNLLISLFLFSPQCSLIICQSYRA